MWNNNHVNLCSCHITFFVLKDTLPKSSRAGNLLLVQPSGTSSTTWGALSLLLLTKRLKASTSHMPWKTMSRMCHHEAQIKTCFLKWTWHIFFSVKQLCFKLLWSRDTSHWFPRNPTHKLTYRTRFKTFIMRCGIKQGWQPSQKSLKNHQRIIQKSTKIHRKSSNIY